MFFMGGLWWQIPAILFYLVLSRIMLKNEPGFVKKNEKIYTEVFRCH